MDTFLSFLSLLSLISSSSVSHAAAPPVQPAQAYWEKALPNTSMPSAIRDVISADAATTVDVGKGGVHVNTSKGTTVNVGHGGVNVNTGHNNGKPPVVVNVSPFHYLYAATDTQIRDDPRVALFFVEEDLHPGTKMKLNFAKTTTAAAFIPRATADSIPFSSTKLPQILKHFAINPKSQEAEAMERSLRQCEMPAVQGESKHCATSLESMVEFTTGNLGTRNIKAVSTTTAAKGAIGEQEYTVNKSEVVRRAKGDTVVACHLEEYRYAVFYCHVTTKSKAYQVKLVAGDVGAAAVEAVAVCHTDTAKWNPNHVAFRVLGVRPGTVPVCHFLPQDHVFWVPRS